LTDGRLASDDPAELRAEADLLRQAFANALAGSDLRLMRGALLRALRSVSGLPRAAYHALRGLRTRSEDADPVGSLAEGDRAKMEEGVRRVESALESEEMRAFLAQFDATFDENLRILEGRAIAGPRRES
jgi:hypothetical protein